MNNFFYKCYTTFSEIYISISLSFYQLVRLTGALGKKNLTYQGMIYRRASERINEYIQKNPAPHVFLGFKALDNSNQEIIIHKMLGSGTAEVFWDMDEFFLRMNSTLLLCL